MGIDIAELRGDANGLVVYFMRAASCAICPRQLVGFDGDASFPVLTSLFLPP